MKVLIVIDMQKGFLKKPQYSNLTEKINYLINSGNYNKIIFTKFINTNGSLFETSMGWAGVQDAESQAITVKKPNNSIIFEKFGYGLSNSQLEQIKEMGATSIDLCGVQTDACVYAIALQLWDNGIFPNILINYTQTHGENITQENTKAILLHQFGKVDEKK